MSALANIVAIAATFAALALVARVIVVLFFWKGKK